MATKGSALSRTLHYFREADPDEARVAFVLVQEIMAGRKRSTKVTKVAAKPVDPAKPKKTWSRRKKVVPPAAQEALPQATEAMPPNSAA